MALGMNYSTAGFELILSRKMSFYIITYYLPSGLFVGISWVSFLINPEVIPGRMTMLVTLFLVLINIHNTIQTNSPKVNMNIIIIHSFLKSKYLYLMKTKLFFRARKYLAKFTQSTIKILNCNTSRK